MPLTSRRRNRGQQQQQQMSTTGPSGATASVACPGPVASLATTLAAAVLYVASGVTQPLLMTVVKDAGLADPTAQLYMLFYYLGPASVSLSLRRRRRHGDCDGRSHRIEEGQADGPDGGSKIGDGSDSTENEWPSRPALLRAASIAAVDIIAQSMNYTGTTMSGPTMFAIIYSSVTVWTAVYSRFLLGRYLTVFQWVGVATVFGGLTLTAFHSVQLGRDVFLGSCLILVGSSVHAMTYVVSEVIMTRGDAAERISVRANCAVQGLVACGTILVWQLAYTRPRFDELIGTPVEQAGTSWVEAALVLGSIGLANFVHSLSFFHTLRHFPGGAVSAGVMKGLQAVLVFVFSSVVFCGRTGGEEMCFTGSKLLSLIVVVGGVLVYGKATERHAKEGGGSSGDGGAAGKSGYKRIPEADIEISPHI